MNTIMPNDHNLILNSKVDGYHLHNAILLHILVYYSCPNTICHYHIPPHPKPKFRTSKEQSLAIKKILDLNLWSMPSEALRRHRFVG